MKKVSQVSFTKATINVEDMTITEVNKDEEYVFDLNKVLGDWDGVQGINVTIKKDETITD